MHTLHIYPGPNFLYRSYRSHLDNVYDLLTSSRKLVDELTDHVPTLDDH